MVEGKSAMWSVSYDQGVAIYGKLFTYGYKISCLAVQNGEVYDTTKTEAFFKYMRRNVCPDWHIYV